MSDLGYILSELHFIRPVWLLLLPVVALVWGVVRWRATRPGPDLAGIAPHLRDALTVGTGKRRHVLPIDGVALTLVLAVLGTAGPTWSRQPDPFVAQTVPLVVVLKVTPSMIARDVAPTRLERAKQKISDLLALRAGARTALVAYAGSAHAAVPMTDDPSVMQPYLEGLAPDVMPIEGDDAVAAVTRASDILAATPGAILFVTDGIDPADVTGIGQALRADTTLGILALLPDGAEDRGIDALNAVTVRVTPDDSDVRTLDRSLNADYRRALNETGTRPWDDRGWMLAWPAALLTLIWFRRGWTMRWSGLGTGGRSFHARPAGSGATAGVADWFLTPDQQGQIAYSTTRSMKRAAELFVDPDVEAPARFTRTGSMKRRRRTYDRLDTAASHLCQGHGAHAQPGVIAPVLQGLRGDPRSLIPDFPAGRRPTWQPPGRFSTTSKPHENNPTPVRRHRHRR